MIHIAAAELGLRDAVDDSAYRDMLWSVARVRSAADLDDAGREAVIRHLKAAGWRGGPAAGAVRYEAGTPAALMRHLWTQLHKAGAVRDESDRALRRYIASHSRGAAGVSEVAPQHLSKSAAAAIIEQLKSWLARADARGKQ